MISNLGVCPGNPEKQHFPTYAGVWPLISANMLNAVIFLPVWKAQVKWPLSSGISSCWPEHLSASSSWSGTETSQWQEEHLALKQTQEPCASGRAFHNGRDREGCEEELCVSGTMSPEQPTISGGDESPAHSGPAKPRWPRKQHPSPNDTDLQQQQQGHWYSVLRVRAANIYPWVTQNCYWKG